MSDTTSGPTGFKPYISADQVIPEFTVKAVVTGALFGILFGASTVYLALKAGLTVSASIPIAVIAISLGRKLLKTTILENNIIQTAGSAGESIAAGVVFTLPGFLFLSTGPDGISVGAGYFNYATLFTLSLVGGILGVLMMIPLRRSLIVKEHDELKYPEGAACAVGAHRRREGRRLRQDRLPGRRHRGGLRHPPEGLPRHRRDPGLGHLPHQQVAAQRHRERRDHPGVHGRRLHHRPEDRRRAGGRRRARLARPHPAARLPGAGRHRSSPSSSRWATTRPASAGTRPPTPSATPPTPSTAPTSARSAPARWPPAASSRW